MVLLEISVTPLPQGPGPFVLTCGICAEALDAVDSRLLFLISKGF